MWLWRWSGLYYPDAWAQRFVLLKLSTKRWKIFLGWSNKWSLMAVRSNFWGSDWPVGSFVSQILKHCSNRYRWHCFKFARSGVARSIRRIVTDFGMNLLGYKVNWGWCFWSWDYTFRQFAVNCQAVPLYTAVTLHVAVTHSLLITCLVIRLMYFRVILLNFLLKILNFQRCPSRFKGAPWMRQF